MGEIIILNPLTRALVEKEKAEQQATQQGTVVHIMSCGGCNCNTFRIFPDGVVACSNCNEAVAGVKAHFAVAEEDKAS